MKKKLTLMGTILCMMCFMGIGSASAAEPSWSDVVTNFEKLVKETSYDANAYNITKDTSSDYKVEVSLTNPTYGKYWIKFTYDNGSKKITYNNERNVSQTNNETQIYYTYTDEYFTKAMYYAVLQAKKINDATVNTDNWTQYGVTLTLDDQKTLSFGPADITNMHPYKTFEINLTTLESAVGGKTTFERDDQSPYPAKIIELKKTLDPMGDCLKDFKTTDPQTPSQVRTNVNPKTGLTLPVALGATVLVLAGVTYVVVRKKNLFRNI